MFTRFAIYYTPKAGTPLATFGAKWLGWDSERGATRSHPGVEGLDVAAITATPRKYGFHGTLKPPFRLTEGTTAQALSDAVAAFCETAAPVQLDGLKLARLGRFLALVPQGDTGALNALAARTVQELDMFRAPLSPAEVEKRKGARLNEQQEAHLIRWGYPHVLDQFRFHMTLTGPLEKPVAAQAEAALTSKLSELELSPYTMTGLTLLGEGEDGRFQQIHRFVLAG